MDLNTIDDGFLGGEELLVLVNMEQSVPTWTIDRSSNITCLEDEAANITGVVSIGNIDETIGGEYLVAVQMYTHHGTLSLGSLEGLNFIAGNGQEDTLLFFTGEGKFTVGKCGCLLLMVQYLTP